MKSATKSIHVRVPLDLYEEFKRRFPGRGETVLLIQRFLMLAIEGADKRDCFVESIYEDAKERYG